MASTVKNDIACLRKGNRRQPLGLDLMLVLSTAERLCSLNGSAFETLLSFSYALLMAVVTLYHVDYIFAVTGYV